MVCRHYLVAGTVQGVSFRRFVQAEALALGVRGWTRNLRDGRVEILAAASADAMEALEKCIHVGPPHSRVRSVTKADVSSGVDLKSEFEILSDGGAPWSEKI